MELILKENTTDQALKNILNGSLDGGLMAGPIHHPDLIEYPVYYEKFYAYVSSHDALYQEKEIDLNRIEIDRVWLLESEHCLRGQIERLCRMKEKSGKTQVKYASGSIDTLIHIVDYNDGLTIIPEMHAMGLSEEQQDHLRTFKNRTAVRQVCLVVRKDYVRETMLNIVLEIIRKSVPQSMQDPALEKYVVDLAENPQV
jgi:LysR family hydrogen peroxide-inducible transcriptional activator